MKVLLYNKHISLYIYIIFFISYIIQTSNFNNQYKISRFIVYLLYIIGYMLGTIIIFKERKTKKSFIWSILLIFVGIFVFFNNYCAGIIEALQVFNLFFLILCSKDFDLEKTMKIDVKIRVISTFLLFIFSIGGIIKNNITVRGDGTIRYAFGYGHANRFGIAIFLIVLYISYLHRNKLKARDYLFQLCAFAIVYLGANSRSASVGILVIFLYCIYLKLKPIYKQNKIVSQYARHAVVGFIILLIILIFYSSFNYSPNNIIMSKLNDIFNSRLVLGAIYSDYYKITPFGSGVQVYTWEDIQLLGLNRAQTSIDILYLKIFFGYGFITFVIYLYIIVSVIRYASKKNSFMLFATVLISVLSCIENQFFPAMSNIFILLFSHIIYDIDNRGDIYK